MTWKINGDGTISGLLKRTCPHCGKYSGYVNVGRSHFFYCKEHRTRWWGGCNFFNSLQGQTEEQQRHIYEELGLGDFEPCHGTGTALLEKEVEESLKREVEESLNNPAGFPSRGF